MPRATQRTKLKGDIQAVFFDVDGVLLDSLPQHLAICRDLASDYGLDISIPSLLEFRRMIEGGARISPMRNFFEAVGFEGDALEAAVETYEASFATDYPSPLFDRVEEALSIIAATGASLGIVTANTRSNVERMLGECLRHFDPELQFFFDAARPVSKSEALRIGVERIGIKSEGCVYVGDQPTDQSAAQEANTQFLAVSYGWGFLEPPEMTPIARSIHEAASMIAPTVAQPAY